MGSDVEEVDADEHEEVLERVAAIDVAKATGKVCVRIPGGQRRRTKVWDVTTTTNAIMNLGDELAEMGIERVVLEATSDYWRPSCSVREARGLCVWLAHARDVKNVPGRPKTDKLDAIWLAKLKERGMLRPLVRPAPRDPRAARLQLPAIGPHRGRFPTQATCREAARGRPGQALDRRNGHLRSLRTGDDRGADRWRAGSRRARPPQDAEEDGRTQRGPHGTVRLPSWRAREDAPRPDRRPERQDRQAHRPRR